MPILFIVKTSPNKVAWRLFWLEMKTGRRHCPGCVRGGLIVYPLFSWLILDDSSGYQPYRSLIVCWVLGESGSLKNPSSMCDRSRSRSLVELDGALGAAERLGGKGLDPAQLGSGRAGGRHPCCSFWWAAAPSVHSGRLGTWEQRRRTWSNWVSTRSFDLSIKATFSVNFGSHSLDSKA